MKFACRHLLCRRDLSCTKVNAVDRLRDGLEASFRLAGEAALPVAAKPAHSPLGPAPNCLLIVSWGNRWQVRWVGTKRCSSADCSVFGASEPRGLKIEADIYLRVSSISEMHLPPA